jgi:hypothetical protein
MVDSAPNVLPGDAGKYITEFKITPEDSDWVGKIAKVLGEFRKTTGKNQSTEIATYRWKGSGRTQTDMSVRREDGESFTLNLRHSLSGRETILSCPGISEISVDPIVGHVGFSKSATIRGKNRKAVDITVGYDGEVQMKLGL